MRRLWTLASLGLLAACAVWLGAAAGAPATAASIDSGRFVWQDLITQDAAACRSFYERWLGWEFAERTRQGKPYLVASKDGSPFAGIVEVKDPRVARAAWLS